jgi:predicted NAD/FAD-dependent oxidoreductase
MTDHGHRVTIFEKEAAPGGRMGSFRWGDFQADAGAQYFTARDFRFQRYVASWIQDGVASPWHGSLAEVTGPGKFRRVGDSVDRYVGMPGMVMTVEHLAAGLDIMYETTVSGLERRNGRWRVVLGSGSREDPFDAVILAVPPRAAVSVLPAESKLVSDVSAVHMLPCWSIMVAFDSSLPLPYDGFFFNDPRLSWAARENSKPGRNDREIWVLHAANAWSIDHEGDSVGAVADELLDAFFSLTAAASQTPRTKEARLWRNAIAAPALDIDCLWSESERIGICGDWCSKSRIEGAFLSGTAVAGRILGAFHPKKANESQKF